MGVGTLVFAVAIGPLTQFFMPRLRFSGAQAQEQTQEQARE
nr:hypothetical protein GCM10020093_027940 [Planobispora longispora]